MDWKKLQNGSDIRGVAAAGVEGEDVNLTPEVAGAIARAFVEWLRERKAGNSLCVAVGTDSRVTGPELKAAVIQGLVAAGADAVDCGMASTPAMFMITIDGSRPCDAGIMITASHLPWNRNGLKFFTPEGGLEKGEISRVLEIAAGQEAAGTAAQAATKGQATAFEAATAGQSGTATVYSRDYMSEYSAFLADYIRRGAGAEMPLEGMKIVVDAGNGAGGFFATKVLAPLGADVSGSRFLEPDGMFPNHVPNPENAAAMQAVCSAVRETGADLGIIFDTDVDRSAIVDRAGEPINRNSLIALISSVILREHPGSTIVTDSVTSVGLAEFIATRGGVHHRFKRGYKNVINECKRLNAEGGDSWLAIETSGHAALRENHYLDDGAFLVAKLLVEAAKLRKDGKELGSLIADLRQPLESAERRFKMGAPDFVGFGQNVLDTIALRASSVPGWSLEKPNYEGVRVNCSAPDERGWFLMRLSLHDPVLPLNIESDVAGGVARIEERLQGLLKAEGIEL
ncbi:MAG: phosphomannomutase/phosphoglucomutase [Bacteroidales bacterium]|nr:phosphomannomutase/phosphoglucomutase [Bacteroidales bacterium]